MIAPLALLAAALAVAQGPGVAAPTVSLLKERFQSATTDEERGKALSQLAGTVPSSAQDISALFDLFTRFPDPELRRIAMASLALVPRDSPHLEPLFANYLEQPEPETQLFGINGAFRLRSRQALPLVWRIAKRKLSSSEASSISVLSQRNAWWTQYEALSALSQWEPEKALPLLRAKLDESPTIGRLMGQFFWRESFPDLARWASAADPAERRKAAELSAASIEPADARATREEMLELVRGAKTDEDVRHRLALKVGACSTDAEVPALIAEHDQATEDKTKLLWAAAVFASRSPLAVPLLARYAKKSPDELTREGARAQLADMVGEARAKALLDE